MSDPDHPQGAVVSIDPVDAAIGDVRVEPIATFPGTAPNDTDRPAPRIESSPSTRGRRFGRLRSKGGGGGESRARMTWNTRFKVAVILSFLILVSALIANKVRRPDKPARPDDPNAGSPALAIVGPGSSPRTPPKGNAGEDPEETKNDPHDGSPRKPAPQSPPNPSGALADKDGQGDSTQVGSPGLSLLGPPSSPPDPAPNDTSPRDTVRRTAGPPDSIAAPGGGSVLTVPPEPVATGRGAAEVTAAGAMVEHADDQHPPDPSGAVPYQEGSSLGQGTTSQGVAGALTSAQGGGPDLSAPPLGVEETSLPPVGETDLRHGEGMRPDPLAGPPSSPPAGDAPDVGGSPSLEGATPGQSPAPGASHSPLTAPEAPSLPSSPETTDLGLNSPPSSAPPVTPGLGGVGDANPPGGGIDPASRPVAPAPSREGAAPMRVSPEQLQLRSTPIDSAPPDESPGTSTPGSSAPPAGFADPRAGGRTSTPTREEEAGRDVVGGRIEPVTHIVRRNENFWTISRYYYGSGRFYRALWMANRDRVPNIKELYVGTPILVPAPEDLDKSYIDPPSSGGTRPVAGSQPTSSTDVDGRGPRSVARRDDQAERTSRTVEPSEVELSLPQAEPAPRPGRLVPREPPPDLTIEHPIPKTRRVHVVKDYETLRSIARKELGDARRDKEILELNSDRIDDPRRLTPGLRLRIPEETVRR